MRFSHAMGIFIALVIFVSVPMLINTDFNTKASSSTAQYASYLQSATNAGISAAIPYQTDGLLFRSTLARNSAVDAYYNVLVKCFNYDFSTNMDMVKYYTPCIFLIDNDGYYIEYTETYNKDGFATYTDIITPINKWSARYGNYMVEFRLDNYVRVTYDGTSHEGYYKDVFKKLGEPSALHTGDSSPNPELPNFDADDEKFAQVRYEYIIDNIQSRLEYYVNTHQEFFNHLGNVQYTFTLPKITGDDWGRLLDEPTIIGFLQGVQVPHSDSFINVYAFTGNELTQAQRYFILYDDAYGLNYYHTAAHVHDFGFDVEDFKAYSMEGAAKEGAHPCPECVLKRYK